MKFHLDAEQLALQETVLGTLEATAPVERVRSFIDAREHSDRASWAALMAVGIAGIAVPESRGGSGLGCAEMALAGEMLGQGAALGAVAPHMVATAALAASADDAARQWLEPALAGDLRTTVALGLGWETGGPEWRDGRISGTVARVEGAGTADLFLVACRGGRMAVVETSARVVVSELAGGDRTRPIATVRFDDAPALPVDNAGGDLAAKVFDMSLVMLAADALGGAQRCLDMSVAYSRERTQFGQPIGSFQALKHQLATMALEVETARALVWYAAWALDRQRDDAARSVALAKAHLADRFAGVARAAVAAHGAIGYTWEYPLNIWYHRSLFDFAHLGTPAEHRARAAALAGW